MATVQGLALWASIKTPNTRFEPKYEVTLVVEDDIADEFKSRGHNIKETTDGPAIVIRRKVLKKDGSQRPAPILKDKEGKDVDIQVGNGSLVRVSYNEYDWNYNGRNGKGLDFKGLQIINLIEYNPDGAELTALEETEVEDL